MKNKLKRKPVRLAVLTDFSSGSEKKIEVHSEPVLEKDPIKRWQLHWIDKDGTDYGQVGQLGLFHVIEERKPVATCAT